MAREKKKKSFLLFLFEEASLINLKGKDDQDDE